MIRKAYPPGMRGKRRKRSITEYGKELKEKQKLRNWYNLRERQFKNYIKEVFKKQGRTENIADLLINKLENRLDNAVFRSGFAPSRLQARQLVSHGHFLVNGKKVNIPSYQVKKGDKITLSQKARQKSVFNNISSILKKHEPPSWIKVNAEKLEGEIIGKPSLEETAPPAEISSIFEFYSR
jgi:small subunit ribosomal protein S4